MLKQSFKVVVPAAPVGKGRPRFTKGGPGQAPRAYTPKATALAENWVRLCCTQQAGTPSLREPVWVMIEAVVPIPASMNRKERASALAGTRAPTTKPDLDNIVKLVLDALNGIAWSDDTRIVDVRAVKRYGPEPCTVIVWGPMPAGGIAAALL